MPLLAALALLHAQCGSADAGATDAGFPATPLVSQASTSGRLRVDVRSSPQPPMRGTNAVELTIVDATTGAPKDGLTVAVVPWMPAMGHGASVKPTVTAEGGGRYLVTNVTLFMPGQWELRTTLTGDSTDDATPTFDVP